VIRARDGQTSRTADCIRGCVAQERHGGSLLRSRRSGTRGTVTGLAVLLPALTELKHGIGQKVH
jgi:hypothetical protein